MVARFFCAVFEIIWPRRRELPYPLPNVAVSPLTPGTIYRLLRGKR